MGKAMRGGGGVRPREGTKYRCRYGLDRIISITTITEDSSRR